MKRLVVILFVTLSTSLAAAELATVRFNLNEVKADIFSPSMNEQGIITGVNVQFLHKLKWSPVDHGCMLFRWGNKENQKKWLNKIFNNDIAVYEQPVVEFLGVTPTEQRTTCLVDNIKYFEGVDKSASKPKEVVATAPKNAPGKKLSSLEVDVRRVIYIPSYQQSLDAAAVEGIKFQYTLPGRAQMIRKGIHPKCAAFLPKNNQQKLNKVWLNSLRGKLLLTDVSISNNGCYFGEIKAL